MEICLNFYCCCCVELNNDVCELPQHFRKHNRCLRSVAGITYRYDGYSILYMSPCPHISANSEVLEILFFVLLLFFFYIPLFWEVRRWNEFISYANVNICMQLKINVVNFNDCFK